MKYRAVLVILSVLHSPLASTDEAIEGQTLHVLLQGSASAALAGVVEKYGGTVTHDLHLIDAVGARVSRQQLDDILESGLVEHYLDDLGDVIPREEDEPPCRVRGHIELQIAPDRIIWPLYNKMDAPATFKSLSLSWPARLGQIERMELSGRTLDPKRYSGQGPGKLSIDFSQDDLSIETRADLSVRFSGASVPPQTPLRQRDFKIDASFAEGCSTDLVPGYTHNHEDYYYNTVAGIDPLHLQGVTGRGVTVAVVDSGLWEHPALMKDTRGENRVLARYDAITDTLDTELVDESGHGTHMSSITANSGLTLRHGHPTGTWRGVAPDARLVAVKILDREGQAHLLDIVRAIQWVVDHRDRYGVRVLNLSFAQRPRWHYWEDPVNQAVMRAWAAGIVVVAAAGNEGPDHMTVGSPANQPYVISVGAVTDSWTPDTRDDDYIPDFSSRGPTPAGHVKPDIVALGGHMTGLIHPASDLATTQPEDILASGEFVSTGSSQAAALVSGIAALLLQLEPELSPDDVKCKLISSAEPAINADGKLAYSPFQQGYGYVTASRAVTLGKTGCGNTGLDIQADIAGERHFFGPAEVDEDGSPRLPLVQSMIAVEPSAEGMSESRRWGVKDHIERLDNSRAGALGAPGTPFDWQALYAAERERIERLASQPPPTDQPRSRHNR